MRKYLLTSLLGIIVTTWGIVTIFFLLFQVLPGDPVLAALDPVQAGTLPPAVLQQRRDALGLSLPRWRQYIDYIRKASTGDLGTSWETGEPVAAVVTRRLPLTISLALGGVVVSILVGIPAGIIAAFAHNRFLDRLLTALAVMWMASPSFWLALLLLYFFAFLLGWFPVTSASMAEGMFSNIHKMTLPALAVGLSSAGLLSRLTRSSMLEVLGQDYIRTARAKGQRNMRVLFKHALRNALIPVVTLVGVNLGYLLGGAVVTEIVFAMKGIGSLIIHAIDVRDYPTFQGAILIFSAGVIIVNFAADIACGIIDPRIRYE